MMRYIALLLLAFVVLACDPVSEEAPVYEHKARTVLVYMAANNNLSSNAESNLLGMKEGFVPEEDNLLVYMHLSNTSPVMLRIYKDESGAVQQDTVYRFPVQNSADAKTLGSVLKITRTMFPADEYGLVLWSHGTGWLPEGYYAKSFGADSGREMDVRELAAALPFKMEFLLFDACLMGGIEVAYELKDSVNYVISSPAEILSQGFPYSKIMKHIYSNPMNLQAVAREYYDSYNGQSGSMRSATISIVKCEALGQLANEAAKLFREYGDNIRGIDMLALQRYYRGDKYWFYDFGDFMKALSGGNDTEFAKALENAVVYKAATPNFLEVTINPNKYSGLSTYIPSATSSDPELLKYYANFKWSRDTGYLAPEEQ